MYFLLFLTFLAIRLYIVLTRKSLPRQYSVKNGKPSLGIFLGSGGHTAEMLKLVSALDKHKYRRVYITSDGDTLSTQKAREMELVSPSHECHFISIPRARKVHQSMFTAIFSSVSCLLSCIWRFCVLSVLDRSSKDSFDVLLLNGPGTCVILCLAMYIKRFAGLPSPLVIYVESFARVRTLSLTGRLLRPLADRFITQWPETGVRSAQLSNSQWLV